MASRKVRRGQLIQPFGVGGLIESEGESFVVKDITSWSPRDLEGVDMESFRDSLKWITELKQVRQGGQVPVARFPRWLFCPRCRKLEHWSWKRDEENGHKEPRCDKRQCRGAQLVPMRFVAVCNNGHLGDIDWWFMVHRNREFAQTGQCDRRKNRLEFKTMGNAGGDFGSMWVSCLDCPAKTNLEFIQQRKLPGECRGGQPWRKPQPGTCNEEMVAEPRGSSALHYSDPLSLLDINLSQGTRNSGIAEFLSDPRIDSHGQVVQSVKNLPDKSRNLVLEPIKEICLPIAEELELDFEMAWKAFLDANLKDTAEQGNQHQEIDLEEVQDDALRRELEVFSMDSEFNGEQIRVFPQLLDDGGATTIGHYLRKVSRVTRLREVRIFHSFYRRKPGNPKIPADLGAGRRWLPASEVIGEGLFLEFRQETLRSWLKETRPEFSIWLAGQVQRAQSQNLRQQLSINAAPLFVAAHTFAHLLLRAISYECGYSSNSIRERIYYEANTPYAGVLLYTADSDAEGSLGGLVEMGYIDRLEPVILRALAASRWCSSDPVCRESSAQGLYGLNRAACHACCLVAETSCPHANSFLDRVTLSGGGIVSGGSEPRGFFTPLLENQVSIS